MTTEEKAQAYEKAIEQAKKELAVCDSQDCDAYRQIIRLFPELQKNEDEKIRKELINTINLAYDCGIAITLENRDKYLAWLEKQGEQKSVNDTDEDIVEAVKDTSILDMVERKFKVGDFVKDTNHHKQPIYKIVYIDKECYICESDDVTLGDKSVMHFAFDNPYLRLVEQKQQPLKELKIADIPFGASDSELIEGTIFLPEGLKAIVNEENNSITFEKVKEYKPKFEVGNWITNGGYTWFIEGSHNGFYDLVSLEGCKTDDTISHVDENFHVWSINDAKDGDVLTASDGSVFIFASTFDCGCKHYIALTKEGQIDINKGMERFWETARGVCPATKKQRDLLFQKMREAGYRWDSEEKRPIRTPKPKEPTGVLKQLLDEESKWSEEDREMSEKTLYFLDAGFNNFKQTEGINDCKDWIKSIKSRLQLQPKQEWKPSEEQLEALDLVLTNEAMDDNIKHILCKLKEQLKKL